MNFWATWCPPCRRETPDLEAVYERFRDPGLVILAVTDEDISKVEPFVLQQGVTYPVLLDPGQKVRSLFRIDGIPHTLAYNREGKLIAQAPDRPSLAGLLEMLAQAGLR